MTDISYIKYVTFLLFLFDFCLFLFLYMERVSLCGFWGQWLKLKVNDKYIANKYVPSEYDIVPYGNDIVQTTQEFLKYYSLDDIDMSNNDNFYAGLVEQIFYDHDDHE